MQRRILIALVLLTLLLAVAPVAAQEVETWDVPKLGPWDAGHDQVLYCVGGGVLWISPVADNQALVACIPYATVTPTFTPPPSPLDTPTPTAIATLTPTLTPTATWTATPTATSPPTATATYTPTATLIVPPAPTATATLTPTEIATMTVTISDTFSGASATLDGRTPDTVDNGNTWTVADDAWITDGSGNAVRDAANWSFYAALIDSEEADGSAEMVVNAGGAADYMTVVFRRASASSWWLASLEVNEDRIAIYEWDGASNNIKASTTVTVENNVDYTLAVTWSGANVSATVNGGSEVTYGSVGNLTSTTIGFAAYLSTALVRSFEFDDGAAGGDLSVSVSDSASLSESVTVWTDIYHKSVSDSASVADTPVLEMATALSVSDNIGVTDTPALFSQELPASVSDNVTVADTPVLDLPIALAVSDIVYTTDNFPGDEVIVGEDIDLAIPVALAVSDSASLSDTPVLQPETTLSVNDSVGLADTPLLEITLAVSVGDNVSLTDTPVLVVPLNLAVTEAIGLTDTPTLRVRAPWYNTDTLTVTTGSITSGAITDTWTSDDTRLALAEVTGTPGFDYSFTFYDVPATVRSLDINGRYQGNVAHDVKLYQWNFTLSQWVALTADDGDIAASAVDEDYEFVVNYGADFLVAGELRLRIAHTSPGNPAHILYLDWVQLATHPVIEVADPVTVTDSPAIAALMALAVSDAMSVQDTPALDLPVALAVQETIGVAENIGVALGAVGSLDVSTSDSISLADTPTLLLPDLVPNVSESIGVGEAVNLLLAEAGVAYASASDNVTLSEALALQLETALAVQETISASDTPNLILVSFIAVDEAIALSDTPTLSIVTADLALQVSDSVGLGESQALAVGTGLAVQDGVTVQDQPGMVTAFALAVQDTLSVADQPSLAVLVGLAVQDGIALNENLDFLASDPKVIISDGVGVTDDPTVALPGNYFDLATTQSISVVELVILSIITPGSRVIPIGMTLKRVVLTQRVPRTVPVVAEYP